MKTITKLKPEQFVEYFHLQTIYSTELPDNVPGFLDPASPPRYICINANKAYCDQVLTIFHEMAHYVLHQDRPRKLPVPWFLDYPWKSKLVIEATQDVKAYYLKTFDREWEANFWAFAILWRIGAVGELLAIVKLYPDLKWMFGYSLAALLYSVPKQLVKNFYQRLVDF